jgi:hypothetical protein
MHRGGSFAQSKSTLERGESSPKRVRRLRVCQHVRHLGRYLLSLPPRRMPHLSWNEDRLYLNHYKAADHALIAEVIQRLSAPWLVSYDAAPQLLSAYAGRKSFVYDLQYNAGKAYKGREVFFFSDSLEVPAECSLPAIDVVLREFHRFD